MALAYPPYGNTGVADPHNFYNALAPGSQHDAVPALALALSGYAIPIYVQ
jgi:hypothetical protein